MLAAAGKYTLKATHLPHSAVYRTFTMMSPGSLILGMGLCSILTFNGPSKMTACIVSLLILQTC